LTLRPRPLVLAAAPVLLAIAFAPACRRDPPPPAAGGIPARSPSGQPSGLSDDQLVAFTRWQREGADLLRRHRAELDAVSGDDPSRRIDAVIQDMEPRVAELVARQAPVMQAHLDRVPLKGRAAELATEAMGGLFHVERTPTGFELLLARDEVRLGAARRRFEAEAVDDILAREALILAELRRAGGEAMPAVTSESAFSGVPGPEELEAFVSGAGAVRLGMTEGEISAALGKNPTRRRDPPSPDAPAEASWEGLEGARPGAAAGLFREGRLLRIEFAPATPALPRLDRAAAESVTRPDFVRRSVARTLRMADIEAVTRRPGYRATWAIASGFGSRTTVSSRWLWEIEPGGKVLYVEEHDGAAGQPVIRSMR
jgi:hypothetical protein